MSLSRRHFVQVAGASLLLQSQLELLHAHAQAPAQAKPAHAPGQQTPPNYGALAEADHGTSKVALVHGDDRRKNIYDALTKIDDQIKEGLKRKKYVLIKPNNVSVANQLSANHVDALRGILDYLEPRFHGPVIIAESSAQDTLVGFENYHYVDLPKERPHQKISLIDLNREGKYVLLPLTDADLHVYPVRLAARVLDPDAFVISSAMLKTHNIVVATMTVKNMVMGSPLKSAPGADVVFNDKQRVHPDIRQANINMLLVAQKLQPNWGLGVIDGFEGMEHNGPNNGTPVPSHVAIASTDLVAADRVGLEVMGINPDYPGYLNYAGKMGLGQFDLNKIEVLGPPISTVQRKYLLSDFIQHELEWRGPLTDATKQTSSLMPQLHDYLHG